MFGVFKKKQETPITIPFLPTKEADEEVVKTEKVEETKQEYVSSLEIWFSHNLSTCFTDRIPLKEGESPTIRHKDFLDWWQEGVVPYYAYKYADGERTIIRNQIITFDIRKVLKTQ
jgi:hypothetical protein